MGTNFSSPSLRLFVSIKLPLKYSFSSILIAAALILGFSDRQSSSPSVLELENTGDGNFMWEILGL